MSTINVIGMGYVGLTLALIAAEVEDFKVIGVERDAPKRLFLEKGVAPFYEEGLGDLLKKGKISFTASVGPAAIHIICVGSPAHDPMGAIEKVVEDLVGVVRPGDLVIFRSTAPIGSTRKMAALLPDFVEVAFAPERTAEGVALQELKSNPQIVGGPGAEKAAYFFRHFVKEVLLVDNYETAEMCKLTDNCWRAWKFAFANQLAMDAPKVGVNAWEVIEAVSHNFKRSDIPSPGFSLGPCLSKDPEIYAGAFRTAWDDEHPFVEHGLMTNVNAFLEILPDLKGKRVGLLGAAFKAWPRTDDLRNGPLYYLNALGVKPAVYDPHVPVVSVDYEKVWKDSDVVVVGTSNFKDRIPMPALMKKGGIIVDMWNTWPNLGTKLTNDVEYRILGR